MLNGTGEQGFWSLQSSEKWEDEQWFDSNDGFKSQPRTNSMAWKTLEKPLCPWVIKRCLIKNALLKAGFL